MRMRTVGLLSAAAVFAAIAAYLTKAQLTAHPQSVERVRVVEKTATIATTPVIVAAKDLPFGTKLTRAHLKTVSWPSKLVPKGIFRNTSALLKPGAERVVMRAMVQGEPVLTNKISKPGYRPSLAGTLNTTTSAVTIRVDDVQGVAGFIQPDDRVDVLLTRKLFAAGASRSAPRVYTDILLQNVKVLAVDQRINRSAANKPARAVTLAVDQVQAQKLVLASNVGRLSLTLKNNAAAPTQAPRRIGLEDLPNSVRPTPKPVVKEPVSVPQPVEPTVTIVRGTAKRESYTVEEERPGTAQRSVGSRALIEQSRLQGTGTGQAAAPTIINELRPQTPIPLAARPNGFATAQNDNEDNRTRELNFRGEPQ